MSQGWRVGIDIGGTFTDVVAQHPETQEMRIAKVSTTPGAPLRGLTSGLEAVGLAWADVAELVHGTTMVTNALVESRLAPVALVATRGFADVLDIARASRRHLYRLDLLPRPRPDVPDALKFEVGGRIDAAGIETAPLDPEDLAGLRESISASGAEAVAVSLLHGYANPAHERAVAEALSGAVPFVSVSHALSPEAREYERTATTVLNASLMPMVANYMDRLTGAVPAGTRVQLFHSAGGMIAPATVRDRPLSLALSGPAAGAAAAAAATRDLGLAQAISFDMGGTTTDVCLIRDGAVEISSNRAIAGRPIRQPVAAIETIGAGGGSIVTLGAGGLSVGPDSAGADPGPACYGLGGTRPTIADADLLLGWLDPTRPLGGRITLDAAAARAAAIEPVASALGQDVEATALGIAQVAHALMARALRRVSVDRGIDARDCALIAFGGAGPMHACGLADETGIDRIVVPAASGAFSALGCTTATARHARQRTLRLPSRNWSVPEFAAICAAVDAETSAALIEGQPHESGAVRIERVALVRYAGQSGAVEVPLGDDLSVATIGVDFRAAHRQLYGFATDEDWVLEALRVTASLPETGRALGAASEPPRNLTLDPATCRFDASGPQSVQRLWRSDLVPEARLSGPLLIVDDWSTTVVAPGFSVRATAAGHLLINREARP